MIQLVSEGGVLFVKGMFGIALLKLYQLCSTNSHMEQLHCGVSEFFLCVWHIAQLQLQNCEIFVGIVTNTL
jgi:hypothetical protein